MKFIYFLFPVLIVFLSGCSLPGTQSEWEDLTKNTIVFENSTVSLLIPKTWSGMTSSDFSLPWMGSVIAAYVSPEIKWWYSNSLVILEDSPLRIMTSKRYSELNHIQTTKNYLEYKKIKEREIVFSDNDTSTLYIFEARYNETTPRMRFIQTARVCGNKVYILHFSLSLDKNPDIYSTLFESFTCK